MAARLQGSCTGVTLEETKAQRAEVTIPKPQTAELGLAPWRSALRVCALDHYLSVREGQTEQVDQALRRFQGLLGLSALHLPLGPPGPCMAYAGLPQGGHP